jgi:adenylate cyclase
MSFDVETIDSAAMPNDEIRAVAEWLIDGARSAPQPQQVLTQLCERLVACGIPLWRVAVFIRTLHPNVMGRRFVWRPGAEVEAREAPFELLETSDFLDSTIARVYLTADPIRRRLAVPDPVLDFPILSELRAEGVTDYLATPLVFTDGTIHVATWTTHEPDGFTDAQVAGIEAIVTPLARVAEVRVVVMVAFVPHREELAAVARRAGRPCALRRAGNGRLRQVARLQDRPDRESGQHGVLNWFCFAGRNGGTRP